MSTAFDRFQAKVSPCPIAGCHLWDASVNAYGYGYFFTGKNEAGKDVVELAHRAAYKMFVGEIPDGKVVCHECDVPSCVNPEHLFLGTQADNMQDMKRKGRGYGWLSEKTHCNKGHQLSGENLYVKPNGDRACRACMVQRTKEWRARQKKTA